MDIVDTLNRLIPSDQLDDSLIIGQNIDCEAINDFGTELILDDSLKNMLSDKDPMFGCASSQFNLLDTEDSAFPVSTTTRLDETLVPAGLEGELTAAESTQVKRVVGRPKKRSSDSACENDGESEPANTSVKKIPRGRPGRKPVNRVQRSFLIEKGVTGSRLKKELTEGGRINVNDLHEGPWLNPTVVLRRLTVTIGGFRIELLPGPSYSQNDDTTQHASFDDGMSYGANVGFPALTEDTVSVQNPIPDNTTVVNVIEKNTADDLTLGLGPYVNPNDVQDSNGTLKKSPGTQETKLDNHNVPKEQDPLIEAKADIKQSQIKDNKSTVSKTEVKEKQHILAKNLVKPKQEPTLNKNKNLDTKKPSSVTKENIGSQNTQLKNVQIADLQKMKSLKERKDIKPLKRPAENSQGEHAGKVQKIQSSGDGKVKPKLPNSPSSLVKKSPVAANCVGDHQTPGKHASSKGEPDDPAPSRPAHTSKTPDEGGQDKSKVKKPEKIHQRQKSKSSRSISLEEPQLFIPDNAPAAKKDAAEEQPASSETVWDGNNSCGLCKKHHNNMFMVGCGRCDDWFHGDCVGLDLTKVREMEEQDQMYVCLKCCEEESKKQEPESSSATKPDVHTKPEAQDHKLPPQPRPGPSQTHSSAGDRTVRKDPDRRLSSDVRDAFYKPGSHTKHETKSKSSASKKPVSVEAIRRSVRDSLKEILTQRLKESDLNISADRASEVAKKTERELFHLYKDTDNKYKNKYRSLMFNLKDSKNNVLFRRVLKGEISPANLIRMSPEELASKELAAWRQRENRHTIEMIEKEQREVERRPITKITHKGEIEIESQEPVKAPEPVDLEPLPKVTEEPAEPPETPEKKTESTKTERDTTSQHKSHLFDLHCKICTGRMVAPAEEAPTKVVKVATTVVRRQSTKTEEAKTSTPPAGEDDLHLTVLEESFKNAKSSYETKSEHGGGRDEEASFLSNLKSLWRGFIHMHNVAKLVTKAFPVSGILDNLTDDLQDSIQVGGRINPQMVWDYLEKIRASGTKEVCLIRFSPETDEDEISYTLLYAYFSSRKRFGVVSNNLKQVKDMYLIPLGATEKVPHQLVPFDGPGLENNRANLLLGLIIRQRPKRDFIAVDVNETGRAAPEIKPITISTKETRAPQETENFFLSTLITSHKKEKAEALNTTDEPVAEAFEGPSVLEETNNQEASKPLRFLPGVLVGWGGELPPLPDVGGTFSIPVDNPPKTRPPPKTDASTRSPATPSAAAPRERFVIKKKENKPAKADPEISSPTRASAVTVPPVKDAAAVTPAAQISLKDKPPDVSTEAFLASLSESPCETESSRTDSANKGHVDIPSENENGASGGTSLPHSKPQAATEQTNVPDPPVSGILKKPSTPSNVENTEVLQQDKTGPPAVSSPIPVPVLSNTRNDPVTPFHQGYLQLFQAKNKQEEQSQTLTQTSQTKAEHNQDQPDAAGTPPAAQRPPPAQSVTALKSAASPASQQPQVPGSCGYSSNPPADALSAPSTQTQNQTRSAASENTSHGPASPGPDSLSPESSSQPSKQQPSLPRDHRRPEEHYWDPWERPRTERNTEERDHQGKHSHHRDSHHVKKSRHQEREREKKHERGHEDKYREKSRHHGHSDDRYGEKRKERHHSDDHSGRHKDRHRHRRDSDYENGRRSSKDSYS